MNKVIACAIALILVLLAAAGCAQAPTPTPVPPTATLTPVPPTPTPTEIPTPIPLRDIPRISVDEAYQLLGQAGVVFVDTRTEQQYKSSHIKGAILIPYTDALTRFNELPRDKRLIVYCA